ncbi:MAG: class I SAM-dependent methyltransferase [Fimbriimonadales bacterium]
MPDPLQSRYGTLADEYARLWSPVIKPMGLRLLEMLPLNSAKRVLDIGCGTGNLISEIGRHAPEATYFGLDRAANMLAIAAKHSAALAQADGCHLPLRNASFDVAVMAFVLFKYPTPLAGLKEAKRVLRPGAALGVSIWHGNSHALPADEIWEDVLADIPGCPDEHDKLEDLNEENKLRDILSASCFSRIEIYCETFERIWTPESLFVLKSELSHRARLARLDASEQNRRLSEVRKHLSDLSPDAFVWRPSILFAVCSD